MRMLFDHNIDWRLVSSLPQDWKVETTRQLGWEEKDNGELLAVAQREFDVLLTTDKAMYSQQNVPDYDIGVIVLRVFSNRLEDIEPLATDIVKAANEIKPGQVQWIYASEKLRASDHRRRRGEFAR